MKRSSPAAPPERAPRSFWFDPRFGIGLVLVVASVAGVVWLVSAADRTVDVWAARSALSPGDSVTGDDLVLRSVRLGDAADLYLGTGLLGDSGLVVTRAVAAGELVPASAVGAPEGVQLASVVVTVRGELPRSVESGSVVDLWSAQQTDDRGFGPPAVLVGSATVVRVLEADGLIVGSAAVAVEMLVPRSKIAAVLEAIANSDAMSLVPVSLPVGG
ncbi:hypothetical protein [Marisediminicola antarctica]|uniref:SAF domain-containing protein n=1 Tax=Marisediminicola antarctica TaxID=674079 RepID=A0A7L5ANA4_9MICO|nr:hypothetical protein [Marisediminicola antarctica]QHO70794.1 hypothetical protein BHD05_15205 [Marisediminicola antarctica]